MLRKLGRHSRLIYIGTLLQQNEKGSEKDHEKFKAVKESEKSDKELKTVELPTLKTSTNFSFKHFLKNSDPDEGTSDTYKRVVGNIRNEYTGWDRVRDLVRISENYEVNPNFEILAHFANIGFIVGFFHGGLKEYVKAVKLFLLTNDTTKFSNEAVAKKELSRVGITAFFKGGLLTGPKVAFLLAIFVFIHSVISEYRGINGIIEFPIAGGITIAIMKWNLGIRGMISGFCSGLLAGLIMGPILHIFLKINGLTISDARYVAYKIEKEKEEIKTERERSYTPEPSGLEKLYYFRTKHLPPGFPRE